jgi:hypothetical protein
VFISGPINRAEIVEGEGASFCFLPEHPFTFEDENNPTPGVPPTDILFSESVHESSGQIGVRERAPFGQVLHSLMARRRQDLVAHGNAANSPRIGRTLLARRSQG